MPFSFFPLESLFRLYSLPLSSLPSFSSVLTFIFFNFITFLFLSTFLSCFLFLLCRLFIFFLYLPAFRSLHIFSPLHTHTHTHTQNTPAYIHKYTHVHTHTHTFFSLSFPFFSSHFISRFLLLYSQFFVLYQVAAWNAGVLHPLRAASNR